MSRPISKTLRVGAANVNSDKYRENQRKLAEYQKRMRDRPTKAEALVKAALDKLCTHYVAQKGFLRGDTLRIVDFYLPHERLCVEVDGKIHDGRAEYDKYREACITAQRSKPLRFLRLTNEWVESQKNLSAALRKRLSIIDIGGQEP